MKRSPRARGRIAPRGLLALNMFRAALRGGGAGDECVAHGHGTERVYCDCLEHKPGHHAEQFGFGDARYLDRPLCAAGGGVESHAFGHGQPGALA